MIQSLLNNNKNTHEDTVLTFAIEAYDGIVILFDFADSVGMDLGVVVLLELVDCFGMGLGVDLVTGVDRVAGIIF